MKRSLLLILLAALLLGGCAAPAEPADTPAPAASALPEQTAAPAATSAPTPAPTPAHPPEQFPFDFAETLADTEDFFAAVTALGVDWENNWVVHLRLENRSAEVMSIRFLYQSINGLAVEDALVYRLAIGASAEPSFRILREELGAWGNEEPVQWSFTLRVSSAETEREPYFMEELSVAPFGAEKAVRYEYTPDPADFVVMDNEYAVVYVSGWQAENGVLYVDYAAVNRCGKPLLLVLPESEVLLDGEAFPAVLSDAFGSYATLMGTIPVEGWTGDAPPRVVELRLALADPMNWNEPIEDTEVCNALCARD